MSPMKMGSLANALPATANGQAKPALRSWRRSMGFPRGSDPLPAALAGSSVECARGLTPLPLLEHDSRDVVHHPIVAVGRKQRVDEEGRRRIVLRDAASEAGADQAGF